MSVSAVSAATQSVVCPARTVMPFPLEVLPQWLRRYVQAVSVTTQTPPDLAGGLALAVLATALARRVEVRAYAGWTEPVNAFVCIALPPANRKSSVFSLMTRPITVFEADEMRRLGPIAAEVGSRRTIAEQALARAQKLAAGADAADEADLRADADRRAIELEAMDVPVLPRLVVDDCSPERLATLLRDHGGRIAVMAPEGDLFDTIAGRYSGVPNLGVFLRGHAGDELRVDRVGRPMEIVPAPALTMALAVQPSVIAGLAGRPGFRSRGLLGRFWFIVPESTVGRRVINPPALSAQVRRDYEHRIQCLLRLPVRTVRGTQQPYELRLDADAQDALEAFERDLEPRLGEFGDLGPISDWAGKLVGAVVRIAGLLHMAEWAGAPRPWEVPITAVPMRDAITLGTYLISHAEAAFDLMGADPVVDDARAVLRWFAMQAGDREPIAATRREIHQAMRSRFKRIETLERALQMLVDTQQLREVPPAQSGGRGRPSSPAYALT